MSWVSMSDAYPEFAKGMRARHEAAHAVVAHAQGIRVHRLTIDEGEARSWHDSFVAGIETSGGTLEQRAMAAAAGYLSDRDLERKVMARNPGAQGFRVNGPNHDEDIVNRWSIVAGRGDNKLAAHLKFELEKATDRILASRSESLRILADALNQRTALSEQDVLDILGPLPSPRNL
jgi:hypothetical protein